MTRLRTLHAVTTHSTTVCAIAPGGVGNLGPGLDILGCAVEGLHDRVWATRVDEAGISIDEPGHPDLPRDPERHTSALAAAEVLRRAGAEDVGVALTIEKGLPVSGGQGGSSASAVAGAVATNALIGHPLSENQLIEAALAAEMKISGCHADNVAPILLGGIILVRAIDPLDLVRLPTPDNLRIVLAHPEYQLSTAAARRVLPARIDRKTAFYQAAQVGAIVAALAAGNLELLGRAIDDRIAEPARAPLLPGFMEAKRAALAAGALGCSISGAGPSIFALTDSDATGQQIAVAMCDAYEACGIKATARVTVVDQIGARLVPNSDAAPTLRLLD